MSYVFLTYSLKDEKKAAALRDELRDQGLDVWWDAELPPASKWALEVGRALDRSDSMIVLVTPHAMDSELVQRELDHAISHANFRYRIFPVIVEPTANLPGYFSMLQVFDLTKHRGGCKPLPKRSRRSKRPAPAERSEAPPDEPRTESASAERPECFLSHAHQDEKFAYRIESMLAQHGIDAWFAARRIKGAQDWHDQIGDALARCNWFIVVLSPHAVKTVWVSRELKYALNQTRLRGRILPLLHRPCDYGKLSWTLDSIEMIDFRKRFGEGCADLLRIWQVPFQKS